VKVLLITLALSGFLLGPLQAQTIADDVAAAREAFTSKTEPLFPEDVEIDQMAISPLMPGRFAVVCGTSRKFNDLGEMTRLMAHSFLFDRSDKSVGEPAFANNCGEEKTMREECARAGVELIATPECEGSEAFSTASLKKWETYMLQSLVRDRLRDPASAEFGRLHTKRSYFEIKVCGGVNAKNAYGAYVGLTPFFVSVWVEPLEVIRFFYASNAKDTQEVIDLCMKEGIDISQETFP
jgi:hypothetical protein